MKALQKVKAFLKKRRMLYAIKKQRKKDLRFIQETIRTYDKEIPPLSLAEEQEIRDYWNQFGLTFPLAWHRFYYGVTGRKDPRYIPEPVFHQDVKPKFNNSDYAKIWGDKSYIDLFVRNTKTVRSVVRNVNGRFLDEAFRLIDAEEAGRIMAEYDQLVVKPTVLTDTGKGVQLLSAPYDFEEIAKTYQKNYVLQIPLKQHEEMGRLNASSINTIRVNTVLFEKEAHVMSAFVKVGQAGEFADNHGHDRFFIGIKRDGTYCDYAINHDLKTFDAIPSGYGFAGKKVPSYEKVCRAVEQAHGCIAHFGFAFWDVCIDSDGEPVIVEANLRYPDTVIPQTCGADCFLGEYTDTILKYARNHQ